MLPLKVKEKYKLIDNFSIELSINSTNFFNKLNQILSPGKATFLSQAFKIHTKTSKQYIGRIEGNQFHLSKKRSFWNQYLCFATANGIVNETPNGIIINGKVQYLKSGLLFFKLLFFAFYLIAFVAALFLLISGNMKVALVSLLMIFLHFLFITGLYIFTFKISVQHTKREILQSLKSFEMVNYLNQVF